MNLRTSILKYLYKIRPFSLAGDAKFNKSLQTLELSCVINFYKRTELLRNILTCLAEQDLDRSRFEVVLVEDRGGSEEGKSLLNEFENILNINYITLEKNFGKMGYSRNVGITNTVGRHILLLDDDTIILQTNFLSKLLEKFEESKPDGIIPIGNASYCVIEGNYQHHDRYFPASKCTAYTRNVLEELGGFVDEIIGQEDVEFYMRFSLAGKHFLNSDNLEYFHPPFIFNNANKAAAVGLSYASIKNRYPVLIWTLLLLNGLRYLPFIFFPLTKKIRMQIVFSVGFLYGIYCNFVGKEIGYS